MSTICYKGFIACHAQLDVARKRKPAAGILNGDDRRAKAELVHFDGQRKGPKRLNDFAFVCDDNHLGGCRRHYLLAQQCPASALDQRDGRADFIGAIYGEVEPWLLIERRERDARFASERLSTRRR